MFTQRIKKAETSKSKIGLFPALQSSRLLPRSFHLYVGDSDLFFCSSEAHWNGNLISFDGPSWLGSADILSLFLSYHSASFLLLSVVCPKFSESVKASSATDSSPLQCPIKRTTLWRAGESSGEAAHWKGRASWEGTPRFCVSWLVFWGSPWVFPLLNLQEKKSQRAFSLLRHEKAANSSPLSCLKYPSYSQLGNFHCELWAEKQGKKWVTANSPTAQQKRIQ